MKIGVLALQGAFIEHIQMLQRLGTATKQIRQRADFTDDLDGLILPGGESTVMGKLLRDLGLFQPLREAIVGGLPVFGTCAGMILLSRQIEGYAGNYLPALDTLVQRNAYGRQLGSFRTTATFAGLGQIPMVFIRAPYILAAEPQVEILASVQGKVVAARQGTALATAFHPELTDDPQVHAYFLNMIAA